MLMKRLLLLLLYTGCGPLVDAGQPHIVVILADDFGWANFGVHRDATSPQAKKEAHTPNLDGLAKEGVLLDRHYSFKICR